MSLDVCRRVLSSTYANSESRISREFGSTMQIPKWSDSLVIVTIIPVLERLAAQHLILWSIRKKSGSKYLVSTNNDSLLTPLTISHSWFGNSVLFLFCVPTWIIPFMLRVCQSQRLQKFNSKGTEKTLHLNYLHDFHDFHDLPTFFVTLFKVFMIYAPKIKNFRIYRAWL